jgi:hypothetical protein
MKTSQYGQRYREYLSLRGYNPDASKWSILKRALFESWAEAGFHRFWQVWNPGIGYLLFRLYLLLGGKHRSALTTVVVFLFCGFLHDAAVMIMFRQSFLAFSCAFLCFGLLTVASRRFEPWLRQDHWPVLANVTVNVLLVAVSVHAGVTLHRIVL